MSIKLDFSILDAADNNYLDWTQDIQNHLDAQGPLDVIYDEGEHEPRNHGDPKVLQAKRGSDSNPYRKPMAPKKYRIRNNNRPKRPNVRDYANDQTICYKCGGYGHMQWTCNATPETGTNTKASRPESQGIMVSLKLAKPSEVQTLIRTENLWLLRNIVLGTTIGPIVPK
ncbi:hypothetical protein L2E82_02303 [Cichorium intybus]|uniref:Uncharacterized protein n=1 Tax=Cichorium intybus TaxID=13427 RepID=A0ACB9H2D7_CICIN|nr:hypothetical protein L2E82_02303 [Cichorium intybus]